MKFDHQVIRLYKKHNTLSIDRDGFLIARAAQHLNECIQDTMDNLHIALDLSFFSPLTALHYQISNEIKWITADDVDTYRPNLVVDFECLPLRPYIWDLIISNMTLHWINDLQRFLSTIAHALKPGGLFLSSCLTEGSFRELYNALDDLENIKKNRVLNRFSLLPSVDGIIFFLQQAPFDLPVIDQDTVMVQYSTLEQLIHDFEFIFMKEKLSWSKNVIQKIEKNYVRNTDGFFPLTIELIYIHGRSFTNPLPGR